MPTKKLFKVVGQVARRRTQLTPKTSIPGVRPATLAPSINPDQTPITFPCVEAHAQRQSRFDNSPNPYTQANITSEDTGPEPPYARPNPSTYKTYHHPFPFPLIYADEPLKSFDIAYETWGTLNPAKDNVVLLHTGLSASSHAASTPSNPAPGWWEKFIGPGKALDTDKLFVICTNVLGGCYGSSGPSSIDPSSGKPYATRFPKLSIFDMAKAQFHLLDSMGVEKLYASVGCSMGGMQSLAAGWLFPERVGRIVSISGTARSSPSSIAMRYAQRSVLMADPNWNHGFYYDRAPPHTGMKLARQIATITYRSGPEWEQRFSRNHVASSESMFAIDHTKKGVRIPVFCPDFLIETYLDHQGESFCLKYDANSLIYVSKAMDLFDMTAPALESIGLPVRTPPSPPASSPSRSAPRTSSLSPPPTYLNALAQGLTPLRNIPTLVLGVQSDFLFPVDQQRELADALRMAGNDGVRYYELGGVWGHDTFLSLISLVSTSDIRYRGILQQIDHANSTIQLEQVYSMGTEDRRPPAEFLPSNPKPYEYIVFRATEVKDLVVERAVAPPVVTPVPPVAQQQQQQQQQQPPVAVAQPPPVATPIAPAQAAQHGYVAPAHEALGAIDAANRAAPAGRTNGHHPLQPTPPPSRPTNASRNSIRSAEAAVESVERAMGDLRVGNENGHNGGGGGGGRRGGGRRGGDGGGRGSAGVRGPGIVPETPFDFSRSNAKFVKPAPNPAAAATPLQSPSVPDEDGAAEDSQSPGNTTSESVPVVKGFYDKKKSFFDDISSDSRSMTEEERMSGVRGRRDAERNRNLSTFGETGFSGVGMVGGGMYGGGQAGMGGRRGGGNGRRRGGGGGRAPRGRDQ
ncbi:hypothetical protein FRB98_003429 [Tulasnella sp. 332]|nr:hypothetical protein FRB98_003429 [Tulasnella sp. 332]